MKPHAFDFVRAQTVEDASRQLLDSNHEGKLLAGGQSLVPLLNMRLAAPTVLIDLAGIQELQHIERDHDNLRIGAMVRQRDAELSDTVAASCPLLSEAIALVAHPQIRHRGTVGGSIAHADPAAEIPAAVVLLDAVMHIHGPNGDRSVAAAEFFRSFLMTALEDGEVLTSIEMPVSSPQAGWACEELARRPGDYPLTGAAAQVELHDGTIADPRLVLYAVGTRPVRARSAEEILRGAMPEPGLLKRAADEAAAEINPGSNMHASAEYRRRLAKVIARRALERAVMRGRERAVA
jgi:aerobic carbon-monoxide dehydrogenase medium subunit